MGISKEDYNNVLKRLEETNDRIKKIRAEPNHDLILSDPQQAQLSPTSPNPSGYIETTGQEASLDYFYAERGTPNVILSCIGNAALTPFFTCKTEAWGGDK